MAEAWREGSTLAAEDCMGMIAGAGCGAGGGAGPPPPPKMPKGSLPGGAEEGTNALEATD